MKKSILLFFLSVFASCGSNHNDISDSDSEYRAIMEAGQSGMQLFLNSAPIGTERGACYFADQEELASAQLGVPYHIFALFNPGMSNQTVHVKDEWKFPIVVNNEYRCMLTVEKIDDEWQAVSLGAKGFAKSVQTAEMSHPSLVINDRALLRIWSGHPYEILMINSSKDNVEQASFLLLPPAIEWLNHLPEYSGAEWKWDDTRTVPALSFEELCMIFQARASTH